MAVQELHIRTPCCVPGCRRTRVFISAEWICGPHWRGVPKQMRQRLARLRRRAKKDRRWHGVFAKQWAKCRRAAIDEHFMGLQL